MRKLIPYWEFWFAVIGGICLTMVYIFDVKSMVMVQSEQIAQVRNDIAELKEYIKDKDDVTTVFNTKVHKRTDVSGAK